MIEQLFIQLCGIFLAVIVAICIITTILAAWYDIHAIGHRRRIQSAVTKLRAPVQPKIVVVVYAYNNAPTIKACLKSIRQSRYKNYCVTVVDNGSTDATKVALKHVKKQYSKSFLTIVTKRKRVNRAAAVCAAVKKSTNSDLILTIDASSIVSPTLLKESAAQFITIPDLDVVALRQMYSADVTVGSLLNHFVSLSRNMYQKASSVVFAHSFHISDSGTLVRRKLFKPNKVSNHTKSVYASYSVVDSHLLQPTDRYSGIRFLYSSITLITISYFIYTAATLQSNLFLILSWAACSLWLLAVIWSDEKTHFSKKVQLTFTIPVTYFISYIQLFIYLIASGASAIEKLLTTKATMIIRRRLVKS